MKKTVWFILVFMLFTGLAQAKDYIINKKAGNLDVTIRIDRNPPVVGTNNLEISLKDASGREVTDALVTVDYSMPGMPGMPAMNYKVNALLQGGRYSAAIKFSMSGPWNVTVRINQQGKFASAKFTVDVR